MNRGLITMDRQHRRAAFTLLELLVSMGIIVLLTVILIPVVILARRHARDTTCKGNLTQLWKATTLYANSFDNFLPINHTTPLRISNTCYKDAQPTGWGCLYPQFMPDNNAFFCAGDPARDIEWEYGWQNWETEDGEVQCSYGYRGRQGLVDDASTPLALARVDGNPQKIIGCDYYETFTSPARIHHSGHINVLRCNGQVEQADEIVSFGPNDEDFIQAVNVLDR